jgi:Na+/H+ antiporter NhaC
MSEPTWISLLPPILAIVLAITTRQVFLSLAGGIWLGWTVLSGWNPGTGLGRAIDETVAVLASDGDAKVILFTLVIGALIATVEAAGGVRGFVDWIEHNNWVTSARGAQMLAWIIGVVVFIESNITVLVAGSVARPLFDRFRTSREKLAYLIDSTSAPVCILIPLNAWGAYNLGILSGLVDAPLEVFLQSPMKKAEARTREGALHWPGAQPMIDESVTSPELDESVEPRARNMVIPIVVMVLTMPLGLYVTGDGDMLAGSGSTSVLWAVLAGLAAAWILLMAQAAMSVDELTRVGLKGAGGLVPLALILLLAISLGNVADELGTGVYVAQLTAGRVPNFVLVPLIFLVAAGIAFSIGSSWGTFAIMLPIAVPLSGVMGLPAAPFVAASLSGGIFGDHSSPISDTTIISSMAAATDHIDHVRTQLPYALMAGGVATLAFAVLGALI